MLNKRSQTFSLDYIMGMLLFIATLLASMGIIINTFTDSGENDVRLAAFGLSQDLMTEGLPRNWTNETVLKIGLMTDNSFDEEKYAELQKMNYTSTINMLNTNYDYYIFFEDQNGTLLAINGVCGYGSEKVNVTKRYAFAYLFNEVGLVNEDNMFLEKMEHKYNATLYYKNSISGVPVPAPIGTLFPGTLAGGLGNFIQDLDNGNYDLAFLEDPHIADSRVGAKQTFANISSIIEDWVAAGNVLYVIEHFRAHRVFGTYFNDSNWEGDNPVTIIDEDVSLPFVFNESFNFTNTPQPFPPLENLTDYKVIGNYSDEHVGILKFSWGDGTVFFFSELNADYSGKNNLSDEVDYSIDVSGTRCIGISLDNINLKNLRKMERIVPYKSRIIKMIVYTWEENY